MPVYDIGDEGKQYPACESQERARLVKALMKQAVKSSRSFGLNRNSSRSQRVSSVTGKRRLRAGRVRASARIQVVPRTFVRPEQDCSGRFFLGKREPAVARKNDALWELPA
jgi:hypothetical protein